MAAVDPAEPGWLVLRVKSPSEEAGAWLSEGLIACGASAVQVGTALFVEPDAPVKIIKGLKKYLKDHKLSAVTDLIGKVRVW